MRQWTMWMPDNASLARDAINAAWARKREAGARVVLAKAGHHAFEVPPGFSFWAIEAGALILLDPNGDKIRIRSKPRD